MEKEIITREGKRIIPVSRWIKIKCNYNVSKRNPLYCYAMDENGKRDGENGFNPENGLSLDYFTFNGKNYAIEQFISMQSQFCCLSYSWEDKHGKLHFMSGYDSENYYNPLLIEVDCNGEYIKVYAEKN